jgi:hypothetical protein
MKTLAAIFLAILPAVSDPSFRFSRDVKTSTGWCRIELPDDVLDACRPDLPDLRLRDANGQDVAYAWERSEGLSARWELTNVESVPRHETLARVDRGRHAPLSRSTTLEIADAEFLKPVVLESSEDGLSFREVVHGSVFATGEVRATTLRFAPNDRRFWRFRFDDRNGDPIRPVAVHIEVASQALPTREISLPFSTTSQDYTTTVVASLPAANLAVGAMAFSIAEPAFERRVRISERIFFRDEVVRRLVATSVLRRGSSGDEIPDIGLCDLSGKFIEIEIEDGDSPPLHISRLAALARPRSILFFSPDGATLAMLYGSPRAPAPRYDLGAALRGGPPRRLASATLGPSREIGSPALVSAPSRGAPVDASAWKVRQPITVPTSGTVAYLDLTGSVARDVAGLRILDSRNRPVPHIVEQSARKTTRSVATRVSQKGTATIVEISDLDPAQPPDAVTLWASDPEYFSRDVAVVETPHDGRGAGENRVLAAARWDRRPGEKSRPITIPIAPPLEKSLRIEIQNGENAPIAITNASIEIPFVRIDFVFEPGEDLTLVTDNPQAPPARYDLAMVANRVLEAPASAARLAVAAPPAGKKALPGWFWAAVVVAALLVTVALARTLRLDESSNKP